MPQNHPGTNHPHVSPCALCTFANPAETWRGSAQLFGGSRGLARLRGTSGGLAGFRGTSQGFAGTAGLAGPRSSSQLFAKPRKASRKASGASRNLARIRGAWRAFAGLRGGSQGLAGPRGASQGLAGSRGASRGLAALCAGKRIGVRTLDLGWPKEGPKASAVCSFVRMSELPTRGVGVVSRHLTDCPPPMGGWRPPHGTLFTLRSLPVGLRSLPARERIHRFRRLCRDSVDPPPLTICLRAMCPPFVPGSVGALSIKPNSNEVQCVRRSVVHCHGTSSALLMAMGPATSPESIRTSLRNKHNHGRSESAATAARSPIKRAEARRSTRYAPTPRRATWPRHRHMVCDRLEAPGLEASNPQPRPLNFPRHVCATPPPARAVRRCRGPLFSRHLSGPASDGLSPPIVPHS